MQSSVGGQKSLRPSRPPALPGLRRAGLVPSARRSPLRAPTSSARCRPCRIAQVSMALCAAGRRTWRSRSREGPAPMKEHAGGAPARRAPPRSLVRCLPAPLCRVPRPPPWVLLRIGCRMPANSERSRFSALVPPRAQAMGTEGVFSSSATRSSTPSRWRARAGRARAGRARARREPARAPQACVPRACVCPARACVQRVRVSSACVCPARACVQRVCVSSACVCRVRACVVRVRLYSQGARRPLASCVAAGRFLLRH